MFDSDGSITRAATLFGVAAGDLSSYIMLTELAPELAVLVSTDKLTLEQAIEQL